MRRELVLVFALTTMSAVAGRSSGADNTREAARFQETKWIATRSLKEVDPEAVRTLKAKFGKDDRLADHGEPFEAGDILSTKPPRRLVLAGRSGHRCFVAYEVGGRGHHLVLVVMEVGGDLPRVLLLARGHAEVHDDGSGWELDLEDLREALKAHRLYLENTAEPYY